ncbi:LysR substrate-binding domain-containing protein [Pseudonocardia sichuanensis]
MSGATNPAATAAVPRNATGQPATSPMREASRTSVRFEAVPEITHAIDVSGVRAGPKPRSRLPRRCGSDVLERSCRTAGFTPRIAFHANDYQEAQAMVSVGLGVALAPRTAVATTHPAVRVVGLGRSAPSRRILLAHRHDRVRAAAELAMHQVLVEVAREYRTRA